MLSIQCEDLMMLRCSNTKLSMFCNLLSVDEVHMFGFDAVLDKPQFNKAVSLCMSIHFLTVLSFKKLSTLCCRRLMNVGIVELDGGLPHWPFNKTITMVVPFAATAAWMWGVSHPYLQEPLQKGLGEGGLRGFCLVK